MSDTIVEDVQVEATEVAAVTPYGAAKVVNEWLERDGFDKKLPPQMFYNYTTGQIRKEKKPMIPVVFDEDNKVYISQNALETWYTTYTAKLNAKGPKPEPEAKDVYVEDLKEEEPTEDDLAELEAEVDVEA
jgi:hypothetical protein